MSSRIHRRAALAGLAWTALALSTGGCRQNSQTLNFWAMGREGEVVAELLPWFAKEQPAIQVRVQQLPWTAAHEKLLTAFAGDAVPDIAQLGNTWIPEFVALNALEPLDERLRQSQVVAPSDYFEGVWSTNQLATNTYGVPWYVDTRLLFYRTDLLQQAGFAAPPTTWGEWRDMLVAIKARDTNRFGVLLPINEYDPLLVLALQQSQPLLRDDRWGNFRSQDFQTALSFYIELFERGWAPPVSNNQIANLWSEFARGYFSFYITGPWNIGEFKRRLPPEHQDHWMTAPMPGPNGPGASIAGGSSLVLFRQSQRKEAAWQLLEFLSRPEVQERFHRLTGNLPPRRSVWASEQLRNDPYALAFRAQLERVRPAPKVAEWERIAIEMQLLASEIVHRKRDLKSATAELDRRVDAILEKRRWMLARTGAVA